MKKSLMASSVAFVGIGQGGGNIADCFRELGYTTFYINTSALDLKTIDASKSFKYQIPLAQGCSKDREKAKSYTKDYYGVMCDVIASKLGNFSHVFFCFTMGGGTGSGITPLFAKNLIKRTPDMTFGAICALPSLNESPKMKHNAWGCYKELKMIGGLGNVYFLNNERAFQNGKQVIPFREFNMSFAKKLHSLLCLASANKNGNTDESEILTLLQMSGNTIISEIMPKGKTNKRIIPDISLAEVDGYCSYLAYGIKDDTFFAQEEAEEEFGHPAVDFKAYLDDEAIEDGVNSFVIAFGLPFPDNAIQEIAEKYKGYVEELKETTREMSMSILDDLDIGDFLDPSTKRQQEIDLAKKAFSILDELDDLE